MAKSKIKNIKQKIVYSNQNGSLFNAAGGTATGQGTAIVTLENGIARIDFSLKIETSGSSGSLFDYGINRDFLTSATGVTITPLPIGKWLAFSSGGVLLTDRIGYATNFEHNGVFWTPTRMYTASGVFGAWGESFWQAGEVMTGTCFGTY